MEILICILAACLFTEFMGYWLHILLHSEKIPFLSRNHMIHHLQVYPPNKPMRPSREYLGSTFGRANILGIGLEWLLPAAALLPAILIILRAIGISPAATAAFVAASLAWGWLMFGYMHDAMHLQKFWMENHPRLGDWFLNARRRHDIHHMNISDSGLMTKNFGICLFAFDRMFGSFASEHTRFNHAGHAAAIERYSFIFTGS